MQDNLELHYSPEDSTQPVQLSFMCIVKVLITLQVCAGWSGPSVFTRRFYDNQKILYVYSKGPDHTTRLCRIIWTSSIHQWILHQPKISYVPIKGPGHTTRLCRWSGPSLYTSGFYTNQRFFMCIVKVLITLQGCAGWSGPSLFTRWFYTIQWIFHE